MLERARTGVEGLDEMLGGGLPRGRCSLVCGGPGTGKTILGVQFLVNGIDRFDEPGLLVTLEEDPDHIKENMLGFGWDLGDLERKKKLGIVDLSPLFHLSPREFLKTAYGMEVAEFSIVAVVKSIKNQVNELGAKRIVIDPVTTLKIQEPLEVERRRNIAHLFKSLLEMGCTSLLISEMKRAIWEREFQVEEYVAQGAIILQSLVKEGQLINSIQIEKLRGVDHDRQPRPYRITSKGIKVYSKEKIL